MPTNRDFKRLVRARMQKTGEAYTTARAHLLKKKLQPASDYAKLAGKSDATMKTKTGFTWERWVKALDHAGAAAWPHGKIAEHVHETYKVSGWWSQMITVGYERIKGLRAVGQRRDGMFEATKSKTYPVPLSRLYAAWSNPRLRAKWLPGAGLTIRGATREKSIRITWSDRTSVQAWFVRNSASKSQVAVAHTKLADKAAVQAMKAYWDERLLALGEVLKLSAK